MKKIEYREGYVFNNGLTLIKNLGSIRQKNGETKIKGIFRCFCGNLFETGTGMIRRSHTNSCGCKHNNNTGNGIKKYYLKEGDSFALGNLIFIRETPSKKEIHGKKNPRSLLTRMGLFRCSCGKLFEARLSGVRSGNTKTCGCSRGEILFQVSHGLTSHVMYTEWAGIKGRILNKNSPSYKNYGYRGITMFPPWAHDFPLFLDYISALPDYGTKGLTLDRINNDGNYEPGNLRWTTHHFQSINSRKRTSNTSGFVGVSLHNGKWYSYIYVHRKRYALGSFFNIEDAIESRNSFIVKNNLLEYPIQKITQCH